MDDVLATLLLLIFVFGWREITHVSSKVQTFLHTKLPSAVTPFVQWYGLLFVGIGLLLLRTFYDVVRFEYVAYNFLHKNNIEADPDFLPELTDDDREDLHMSGWLRRLSLVAPVAGLIAGIIVMEHVADLACKAKTRKEEMANTQHSAEVQFMADLPWSTSKEMNCVLLVVAMPIVFVVMSMRAEIRMWSVMTGSAWLPYRKMVLEGETPPRGWEEVAMLEIGAFRTNLELAGFFQYITIWNLGKLCISYLRKAPQQYRSTLRFAGLQGVYLYVTFGCLRSIGLFAQALFQQNPKHTLEATEIQKKVLAFVGPIFTVATLLCVLNMVIICKMADVTDRLGSANMKFQATRSLLLISQIQPQVINMLIVSEGIPTADALAGHVDKIPGWVLHIFANLNLSPYRAQLLHAALLNFECLAVVLWNRATWSANFDYEREDPHVDNRSAKACVAAAEAADLPAEILKKLQEEASDRSESDNNIKAAEAAVAAANVAGISQDLMAEMEQFVVELKKKGAERKGSGYGIKQPLLA